IHLDRIGPPHKTPPPTTGELLVYARNESIDLFCGIYEHEETLQAFLKLGLSIVPFYWERRPLAPRIPSSARGVKLHPYIENYIFTIENIQPVLAAVRERNLPVLVHTDDRKPSLSRGKLLASVAKEFHDVTFILAHCGSYAPGKLDL